MQGAILRAGADALRPGGTLVYSTCTISPAENEEVVEAFLAEREDFAADDLRRFGVVPVAAWDAADVPPDAPAPRRHRRLLHRPAAPLGGLMSADDVDLGDVCPDCGEPWLRPTNLPGRYRCVNCLHRFELASVCPNCGEHSTIVRMSSTALYACNHCRESMLVPIYDDRLVRGRAVDPVGRLRAPRRAGRRGAGAPARP